MTKLLLLSCLLFFGPTMADASFLSFTRDKIPAPPPLPLVVDTRTPWDLLGNGLLELRYRHLQGVARAKAQFIIMRQGWESKDLKLIAEQARRDGWRAFIVEHPDLYYVYWVKPFALFYHVSQNNGKNFLIYLDSEEDGINGNEKVYGRY